MNLFHRKRILFAASLSTTVVFGGLALATQGFSAFNSTVAPAGQTVTSGTVTLSDTASSLSTPITNLIPGDIVQEPITLSNSGTVNFGSVVLGVTAPSTAAWDTLITGSDGLTLEGQDCSVSWTQSAVGQPWTCSGTTTTILPTQAVNALSSSPAVLPLSSVTVGNKDFALFSLSLPSAAPNSYQGLSDTLDYTFTATAVPGTTIPLG